MEAFFRQVSSQPGQMLGILTAAYCTLVMHQGGVLTCMHAMLTGQVPPSEVHGYDSGSAGRGPRHLHHSG